MSNSRFSQGLISFDSGAFLAIAHCVAPPRLLSRYPQPVSIQLGESIWMLTIEPGHEQVLVKLWVNGTALSGEASSPRMGTIGIVNGAIHGDRLQWTVPVRVPIAIDLEFSLRVEGDTVTGESRAGSYGTSVVNGVRGAASDWTPWPAPHLHRSVVQLPDGTHVTAVSYDASDPYGRDEPPDFGLYLDRRWAPPWPHAYLDWPDLGLPDQPDSLVADLQDLLNRARAGQRVEVGCLGGHGRTGTALAWLAVLAGEPPDHAVFWVRQNYCPNAVETQEQEAFVARLPPEIA